MENCNAVWTPLPSDVNLRAVMEDEAILSHDEHSEYRSIIGALIHLSVCTRPDITFSVSALALQVHAPTARHMKLLKHVLRYLLGSSTYGTFFPCSMIKPHSLSGYVDADWGGCMDSRNSTTGYILTVNGGTMHWKSQRQIVIALSQAESEYVSLSSCAKQVTWIRRIFLEINTRTPYHDGLIMPATVLYSDSTSAMSLARNEQVSARNKHIDIKMHHIKEMISRKVVEMHYVPSSENIADMLTKPLAFRLLNNHVHSFKMTANEL